MGIVAANHLRGNHPLARWEELLDTHVQVVENQDEASQLLTLILDDPFAQAQIVDVRTAAEFQQKHIPPCSQYSLGLFA
jgi:C4-type Zn-finger protein